MGLPTVSRAQEVALVVLRTLIGWHFLYEGYVKLWWPAWARDGWPLGRWSSAGYLRSASGPLAELFRGLADRSWLPALDLLVAWGLVLVGLSLMLGLFTQTGCVGALLLLAVFYLSWMPTRGVIESGAEGSYLVVNKNLVEAGAVAVVMAFRTGRISGLDLLLERRRATGSPVGEIAP
jgi:thiosulfate dehydrogenase [quinone] large subunit